MSGAPPFRTPAVVLARVDHGEADRIVTLFTASHGKLAALARSARRSQRRFGAALEPFGLLEAAIATGRGNLATLREARCLRTFPGLLSRLPAMQAASAAIEAARGLLPERAADPRVLDAFVELFAALDASPGAERDLRIAFELRVLALVGLSPRLDACARCGKPRAGRAGAFAAAQGGLLCQDDGGGPLLVGARALDAMQAALGSGWAAVRFGPDAEVALAATTSFVDWHVRSARVQSEGP